MLPPLFIGRFQPFHRGHLDVVQQILATHRHLYIGIGSSQYAGLPDNPFPASLRRQMIEESLIAEGVSPDAFSLVEIPDIHKDEAWVAHVERLVPTFGSVYSGTPHVQKLFKKNGTHPVIAPEFNLPISGTLIREKISRNEAWEELVPKSVFALIKKYGN